MVNKKVTALLPHIAISPKSATKTARKQHETRFTPLPAKDDVKALAKMYKTAAPGRLRQRLLGYTRAQQKQFAKAAGLTLRHMRNLRGPCPHAAEYPEDVKDVVRAEWTDMVDCFKANPFDHKECTIDKLVENVFTEHNLTVSKAMAGRIVRELKVMKDPKDRVIKPPAIRKERESNQPQMFWARRNSRRY